MRWSPVLLSSLLLLLMGTATLAQTKILSKTDAILKTGKRLYRSERASWEATDLFLEKYPDKDKIAGYFSYEDSGYKIKTVFFLMARGRPKATGTITFDSSFDAGKTILDLNERKLTRRELDLYMLRTATVKAIRENSVFKTYPNTSLNIIPLISSGEKNVYVISGTQENDTVVFGNDYLLTFNKGNELKKVRAIHQDIIRVPYQDSTLSVQQSFHTHSTATGDLITATDICTLMLYEKLTDWPQHLVIGRHYTSCWNCKTNELTVLHNRMKRDTNRNK